MNVRVWTAGLVCLTLLILSGGASAVDAALELPSDNATGHQGEGNSRVYEFTPLAANTSISGSNEYRQMIFQLPEYWDSQNAVLHLDYQASQLTQDYNSSVTLEINGTLFYSFRPAISASTKQRLSVEIPDALLQSDYNTLTIRGNIRTVKADEGSPDICRVDVSHDNWFQLYDTSSVEVKYRTAALQGTIRDFATHFVGLDTNEYALNAVAVTQNSSSVELEAAAYALSGFAHANTEQQKAIPLATYNADTINGKRFVVLVSLYKQLPAELSGAVSGFDPDHQALIKVVQQGERNVLVVTSSNADMLVKAGRLIANRELLMQLNSEAKIVDADMQTAQPAASIARTIAISSGGDKVTGLGHQEQTYFVPLPANRSIADASKISLDFRYAQNLDFERSLVTVLINNTPVGSKKLTKELADHDVLHLTVPRNLETTGNFSVTVAFDLEQKNASCAAENYQMPWAFISPDSVLQLNTKDRTDYLFSNYPYPFLRDSVYNNIAVILPVNRDAYTYQAVSNLFNLLGQYAEGNTGTVQFYEDNVDPKVLKERNIIAIGTYQDNKVIMENNSRLYFQYNADGSGFVSNEKMSVDPDYGQRVGAIELLESPYNNGHALLVITGPHSEYYYLASKLIASQSMMYKVSGDAVLIDKDGTISAHRFKTEIGPKPEPAISQVLARGDVLGFIMTVVLVLVLVLFSLILMIRKYRKKRGNNDEA